MRRKRLFSPVPLPAYGAMAKSWQAPVASESSTVIRARGKPRPAACWGGCGYIAWFSGVSGIETLDPSRMNTERLFHFHRSPTLVCNSSAVRVAKVERTPVGTRLRALQ